MKYQFFRFFFHKKMKALISKHKWNHYFWQKEKLENKDKIVIKFDI